MNIRTVLTNLNCSDVEKTISRFLDDYELFIKCAKGSITDENWELLGEGIQNRDKKTSFEKSHLLKGVIGNIGLTQLYKSLCELVETLRVDNPDFEKASSLYKNLIQLKDEILQKL